MKNKHPTTPDGWACRISRILKETLADQRFPVDVITVAQDYSRQVFPNDPIKAFRGEDLPGFEGMLLRLPKDKKGWAILYNETILSRGRINFTLAHEFGHYLLHRLIYPNGLKCTSEDILRRDSDYQQLEREANLFAANLLMPFDDFSSQISPSSKINFDMLSHCAERYGVSLIASILQWLKYTEQRAILVVSRDGYILWSHSSEPAFKTGAYFKTSQNPIEIPANSIPMNLDLLKNSRACIMHSPGIWLREEVQEMAILADRYDFAISLLLLENTLGYELPEY